MITIRLAQQFLHTLQERFLRRRTSVTAEQLRNHYEIEKELAHRLKEASSNERKVLYAQLYDELYQRVPYHPQLTQKKSSQDTIKAVSRQMRFLGRFLRKNSIFLEIGSGDCALSFAVARSAQKVYAVDVSEEITRHQVYPQNFELILSDGCNIPLPNNSVTIVYSDQLMEHLHPDDALEQLGHVHRVLVDTGSYVCVTPNRLSGPHDISRHFDTAASGFHLKEYTHTELIDLFKAAGFSRVRTYIGAMGIYVQFPLFSLIWLEYLLGRLPHQLSKALASLSLRSIRIVATK